jgi:hypothetical protein
MTQSVCGHKPPSDDCDFCSEAETEPDTIPPARLETDTFEAPAHWASALINGDLTGLDYYGPACVAEFEAWTEANPGRNVVDCSAEPHIGRWNGLQTELLTYTTLDLPAKPADYEACGECGFDHAYEPSEALAAHSKLTSQSVE